MSPPRCCLFCLQALASCWLSPSSTRWARCHAFRGSWACSLGGARTHRMGNVPCRMPCAQVCSSNTSLSPALPSPLVSAVLGDVQQGEAADGRRPVWLSASISARLSPRLAWWSIARRMEAAMERRQRWPGCQHWHALQGLPVPPAPGMPLMAGDAWLCPAALLPRASPGVGEGLD